MLPPTSILVNLILVFGSFGFAHAFWRLPCTGQSGLARIDPLAQYGRIADHAHAIHGADNFGFESGYSDLMKSKCTSCGIKQDLSVYWTPALYFEGADGQVTLVKQVGGMLVYYLLFGEDIQAFPPGFQMIAGDAYRRNFTLPVPDPPKSEWSGEAITESALRQKALGFNCLDYSKQPEPTLFRHFLPDKAYIDANCPDGVRFELMFPSCWNGELDSADHMGHVAYPNQVITGDCPDGYEKRLVSMLYETIWNTNAFKGKDGRFVLSNGDPTGYGYHGDFIAGWDPDFLQEAIGSCTNPSGKVEDCPLFELQSEEEMRKCAISPLPADCQKEDVEGPRSGLPGDVAVQPGPDYAKRPAPSASSLPVDDGNSPSSESLVSSSESSSLVETTVVPTLSYTSASSESDSSIAVVNVQTPSTYETSSEMVATDEILAEAYTSSDSSSPSPSSYPSSSPTSTTTEDNSNSVTSAVVVSSPPASYYSTTAYITNGTLMQIYIVQETVVVTLTATEDGAATTQSSSEATAISSTGPGLYGKIKRGLLPHRHQHFHNNPRV